MTRLLVTAARQSYKFPATGRRTLLLADDIYMEMEMHVYAHTDMRACVFK